MERRTSGGSGGRSVDPIKMNCCREKVSVCSKIEKKRMEKEEGDGDIDVKRTFLHIRHTYIIQHHIGAHTEVTKDRLRRNSDKNTRTPAKRGEI